MLLFLDNNNINNNHYYYYLNIIVYDLTEDTQSLVKPYTHLCLLVPHVTQDKLITGRCR